MCLTITTEAPRIIKIMVVVIICIKTSKLAAVLWPGVLPAAVETLRLGSGRSVPAGAAHGAAAPLLAPRPFKLPGLPPSPPTHGKPLSQPSLRPRHPSIPLPGRSDAAAARSKEAVLS